MKKLRLPALLRGDGCRVMTAYVKECAKFPIVACHRDNRFAGHFCSHKLSRFLYLVRATDHLPRLAEDSLLLQLCDSRIHIPGRRNGEGFS